MPTQEREETSQPIRERGREGERERGKTTLKQTKRESQGREREGESRRRPTTQERGGRSHPATTRRKDPSPPIRARERERERERRRGKKPPKQQKRVYRQKGESRHHPANTQEKMGWEKPPNKHT